MPLEWTSGGGGAKINGIIEQYTVAAGNSVSIGDFIKYIYEQFSAISIVTGTYYQEVCLLNSTTAVIIYFDQTEYKIYGVVVTINGTTLTKGTNTYLGIMGDYGPEIQVVPLTSTRVAITYANKANCYGTITVLNISGTTISVGNTSVFHAGLFRENSSRAFSSTSIVVLYEEYLTPTSLGCIRAITVDASGNISAGSAVDLGSNGALGGTSICKLSSSSGVIAYYEQTATCEYVRTITISGNTVSIGTKTVIRYDTSPLTLCTISSTKVALITYVYYPNDIVGNVLTISGSTVSKGADNTLAYGNLNGPRSLLVNPNKVLLTARESNKVLAMYVSVNGDILSGSKKVYIDGGIRVSIDYLSSEYAIVAYPYTDGKCIVLNTTTADPSTSKIIGVGKALHNNSALGISKQAGSAGNVVDVIVPTA